MSYANIVHNNSPSSRGVVYVNGAGSKMMMYCIFKNNQNTLFCVDWGSFEVSHSFIDHSASSFSTLIAVSTSTNNSFINRITYQLQFFKSFYCNAQLPVPVPSPMRTFFEMQTPVITLEKSPIRSLEETIRRTNEETIHCNTDIPPPSSTIAETMARTYDSEFENSVLSSDGCLRKCSMNVNMNMFPIFISFVII